MVFLLTGKGYGQILVGPKAGVQYGWAHLDKDEDKPYFKTQPALGAFGGVVSIFKVRERFYLNTALLYSYRRQVIKGNLDPLLKDEQTDQFIDLPITYQMHFDSHISKFKYQMYAGAGPNVSYWLSGKGKLSSGELSESNRSPMEYKIKFQKYEDGLPEDNLYIEDANRIQMGVNAVVGLMFEPQQGSTIMVELRYDYGHSYFARSDYSIFPGLLDYSEPTSASYSAFRLSVIYAIDTNVAERKKGKSTQKKP